MAGRDLVTAVGRLLTDRRLLEAFAADPDRVASRLGLTGSARCLLSSLNPTELRCQADALIAKRLHEVARILPATLQRLGPDGERLFREYAANYWPQGHSRHFEDSVRFADYVARISPRAVDRAEVMIARFRNRGARFAVHWLRSSGASSCKPGVLLLFRGRGGRLHRWILELGL